MSERPDITFIDTETTGLNDEIPHARVVEVAMERVTAWPEMKPVIQIEGRIKLTPNEFAKAAPQALAVNGYDPVEWFKDYAADVTAAWTVSRNGLPATEFASTDRKDLWKELFAALKQSLLCGQNIEFDRDFIQSEMMLHGLISNSYVPWQRRMVDVQGYSHIFADHYNAVDNKGRHSFGLDPTYRAMGGPPVTAHRARPDVVMAKHIYDTLRRHVLTGLEIQAQAAE